MRRHTPLYSSGKEGAALRKQELDSFPCPRTRTRTSCDMVSGLRSLPEVDNKMTIAQEEIFGPVLSIIPYSTEEDRGLSASV